MEIEAFRYHLEAYLDFMLHAVEVLVEDVDVERLEFGLEHVVVVPEVWKQ